MALKNRIGLRQRAGLALSPLMRQSISLLRMPAQSLTEAIAIEAAENPFLIVEPASGGGSAFDYAIATAAAPESLGERLCRQIAMQKLDGATEAAAQFLIGELREDGYLDQPLDLIAGRVGVDERVLARGLAALQRCEPTGIGARTLAEYVELQVVDAGFGRDTARAAAARLNDFAEENWRALERQLGLGRAQIEAIAKTMRTMPSAPVATGADWTAATTAEIAVEKDAHNRLSVVLLRSALPSVTVMSADRDTLGTAALRDLLDRAVRFSSALSARADTLLRIGSFVATRQASFFLGDHDTIMPVTRADAAAELGMHPSTLGRAIAGKALLADNRLYPLSHFFTHALPGAGRGISPFDVQRRVRQLVAAESADAPLADEAICAQLKKEGVDIARRTVAKYRKCMRIPSSFARRRRKVSKKSQPLGMRKAP